MNSRQEANWIRFAVVHRMPHRNFSRVNDRHMPLGFTVFFCFLFSLLFLSLFVPFLNWIALLIFPPFVYREEIRWAWSGCLVAGSHFVHIGKRLTALRRIHTSGAKRARSTGKISHPFLHVYWLRKSTQEVSRSKSDKESIAWGESPLHLQSFSFPRNALVSVDRWLTSLFVLYVRCA